MKQGSQSVKRTLKLVVVVVGLGAVLMAPAFAHARLSLEPMMERNEVLAASSLSLPGNLAGGASVAWDAPTCRPEPGSPLLPASALSLPGEVVEDVLLVSTSARPASK